jgi:hypothetical protein
MFKTDDIHQRKILIRYLEFSNLKEMCIKYANFSFNYIKKIMSIDIPNYCKRVHFNIYDFIDWDQAKYPNDPCFVSW